MAAFAAGPLIPFVFQEGFHAELPDIPQVFRRGFVQRIFGSVAVLLFHDVFAGIIRAFIAEFIAVLLPLFAEDDAAPVRAELRLVFVGTVASRAGVFFRLRALAQAAVQAAGGNHFSGNKIRFHFSTLLAEKDYTRMPGGPEDGSTRKQGAFIVLRTEAAFHPGTGPHKLSFQHR